MFSLLDAPRRSLGASASALRHKVAIDGVSALLYYRVTFLLLISCSLLVGAKEVVYSIPVVVRYILGSLLCFVFFWC